MPANRVQKYDFDVGMLGPQGYRQVRNILQNMLSRKEEQREDMNLGGAGCNGLPDGRGQIRLGKRQEGAANVKR